MTVSDSIRSALRNWGEQQCLVELHPDDQPLTTSAEQSLQDIAKLADRLRFWGVRPRYLVPIFLENSMDFIRVFLALLDLQAVPVLVKLDYRRIELDEIFANSQPQAVITESRHIPLLKSYLSGIIVIEHSQQRFSLCQSGNLLPLPRDIPDDIASINYTYRGNGYPLGAMISHSQYLHGAKVLQDGLQGQSGEKMLVILPMSHIFTLVGCLMVPLLFGMTIVIARTLHPRYLFNYVEQMRIDHICSIPEIYEMLHRLRDPGADLSSLKVFVSGGSLLPSESYSKIKQTFSVDLLHGYGLTEFTPVSRNVRKQARAGTVGTIGREIECRIKDPDAAGAGEIQIKTPSRITGYLRRPDETCKAFVDGWFRTGDMGFFDGGHLVFVRELKQTRKINGNIVDLEELRRAILIDSEVAECQIAYENNSISAKLVVNSRVDSKEKAFDVRARLSDLIAEYKIPRKLEVFSHTYKYKGAN